MTKALRIILTQSKAHYKKEESDQNKLTYPLPPFSTVIGAIHNACSFREYKKMDISIQGDFKSMSKQAYTDHCFLDLTEDDRGILVKLVDDNFQSKAFVKVAQAKKGQGNSFRKGTTIDVYNQELLDEYRELKKLNDDLLYFRKNKLDKVLALASKRKKSLKEKKKHYDKKTKQYHLLAKREEEIRKKERQFKETYEAFKVENYSKPISKFQTLTTSLKFYEVLHEVKLILHVMTDEETLKTIKENIYCLKSIGRSEDFVDVQSCEYVMLQDKFPHKIKSSYSAYLSYDLVKGKQIQLENREDESPLSATVYWINKRYDNTKGYRDFEKVKVVYSSNYSIDSNSKGVYYDGEYIINFN